MMVSGDTGPAHIATALGTPMVGIYGPTDPTCAAALTTSTMPVSGAGTYQSAAFPTNTLGTYRWIARQVSA